MMNIQKSIIGNTEYIIETLDNGTVIQYPANTKNTPFIPAPTPDPQPEAVTLDQVYEQNLDIMDGIASLYEMQAGGAE